MGTYTVYLEAYFSDSVEVEADSYNEAEDMARQEFENDYSVYSANGGYTVSFDNFEISSVDEPDEEDE